MDISVLEKLNAQVKKFNADATPGVESFLFLGYVGTGKTTLIATIPAKRTFFHFFEPNGPAAIARLKHCEYKEFLPKRLLTTLKPIPKEGAKGSGFVSKGADVFREFENFFVKALDSGFYDQYDVVAIDSLTTLQEAMLDDVLARDNRMGFAPERNDRSLVGFQLRNLLLSALSIDRIVCACAHLNYEQDDETKRLMHMPILVGQQKTKTPQVFTNVFICEYEPVGNDVKYFVRSIGDNKTMFNLKRSARFSWIDVRQEVTIKEWGNLQSQGLGKLFKEAETRMKGGTVTPKA